MSEGNDGNGKGKVIVLDDAAAWVEVRMADGTSKQLDAWKTCYAIQEIARRMGGGEAGERAGDGEFFGAVGDYLEGEGLPKMAVGTVRQFNDALMAMLADAKKNASDAAAPA